MKKVIKLLVFILSAITICGVFSACESTHQHSLGEWKTISEATCTNSEVLERKCSSCDYAETKLGKPAKGHNFIETIVEPTQTEVGYTNNACHCGTSYKDNYKCLITFISKTDGIIEEHSLPQFPQIVVNMNSPFVGVTVFKPTKAKVLVKKF